MVRAANNQATDGGSTFVSVHHLVLYKLRRIKRQGELGPFLPPSL